MADRPWLTIVGLGEDGPDGLSSASLAALENAEIVMGPARHLSLLPKGDWEPREWPVPFADGIEQLQGLRGRRVVVLASGDPFWFGAGSVITRDLQNSEWQAFPAPSTFSHVAARMGWPIEKVVCIGLHAAPLSRLRPHLATGRRIIVLLRDGQAVAELSKYLLSVGFEESRIAICEAVAGPRERITHLPAADKVTGQFDHPVCAAIEVAGDGAALPMSSGRADTFFEHDGQLTKRPIRALTLSTLAPQYGEHLWDIGGGSGSIAIEWLLCDPSLRATTIEINSERAKRIKDNSTALGVDRLDVVAAPALDVLDTLQRPDAVFVGGGLSADLVTALTALPAGTRLVMNAVTLEAEALLAEAQAVSGGTLMRIDLSQSKALGSKRGWQASYPIVQWSVTL